MGAWHESFTKLALGYKTLISIIVIGGLVVFCFQAGWIDSDVLDRLLTWAGDLLKSGES